MAPAKWALEGVSESLAAELKRLGIKVIIVQPGPFRTEFSGRTREKPHRRGKFLRFVETMNGRQPGGPDKAADAIIGAESRGVRCRTSKSFRCWRR